MLWLRLGWQRWRDARFSDSHGVLQQRGQLYLQLVLLVRDLREGNDL